MVDFPTFPEFKRIEIADKNLFGIKLKDFKVYSDFNLLSLLSWNVENSNSFCILNDNLTIKIKNYLEDFFDYSILGINKIDDSLLELLKITKKLSFVPEEVINNIKNKNLFSINEDRDNFDYILSTKDLSELKGHKYKSLRHNLNRFNNIYNDTSIRELEIDDRFIEKKIEDLTNHWCNNKNFSKDKILEENKITHSFLEYAPHFNCVLLGLYINNKLEAYTFNEIVNNCVIGHFGASNYEFEGSSHYMECKTAEFFCKKGFSLLNHEQDTGIPGLREAKMSYHPIKFLKKYTISLN